MYLRCYSLSESRKRRIAHGQGRLMATQIAFDPLPPAASHVGRKGGGSTHKRLLKKMAFSRPLGIGKSFNDFAPMCECVNQPCSGKNGCEYLAEHVFTFTPSATAMGPTDIPRGKSFLPRRSFVR